LGAGAAAIVLAEILMAGLFTEDEVERRLGLPYLGAVPTLGTSTVDDSKTRRASARPDYLLAKPLSSFAESFRKLRAAILFSKVGETVKVIAGHLVPAGRRQDHDHLLAGPYAGDLGRQCRRRRLRPAPERHQPFLKVPARWACWKC
jgi:hypothetical protein